MTIDVSTILKELGGKIDINGDVEMSDTDFLGEMYHFNEPVKVSGSVSNNGKSLILKANCTRSYDYTVCKMYERYSR